MDLGQGISCTHAPCEIQKKGWKGGGGEGEEETFGTETEQSTDGAELISFTLAPCRHLSNGGGRDAGGAPRIPRGRRSATTAAQHPTAAPSAERLRTATRSREPSGGRGGATGRSAAPHREVAASVRSVPRCGSRSPSAPQLRSAHRSGRFRSPRAARFASRPRSAAVAWGHRHKDARNPSASPCRGV